MSENAEYEHAMSISELGQDTLEAGLIARLVAHPSDYFLYVLFNIDSACFTDAVARRVYGAIAQGITVLQAGPRSNPTENLNLSESDEAAFAYLRSAVKDGYPCAPSLAPCLLALHDRSILRRLAEREGIDEEWERLSQELADDPDEMPW